ncbi:mitochondrial ribosomal protein-like protein subunit S18 [Melanomma pulvis-pyrius CBS 109.77]|uniref:Small ribosomal subunit protein uS11m n=1 Tax=Melanomma pulvis-pyrius CBS 109.77 TaxID=1314802 RepID=A0A6A6X6A3_9PLEO|nr:mitochondrial ribosomal protein-like protein subunit S18 [Melanomma pulvis-pyrius CBS 109.77]
MGHTTALRICRSLQSSICAACRSGLSTTPLSPRRPFSTSPRAFAVAKDNGIDNLLGAVGGNWGRAPTAYDSIVPNAGELSEYKNIARAEWEEEERHHLHVYAHKHNTHITLTKPNRDSLISVSCGNIGFKKAGRGTYDAAYQLAAFVMSRIQDKGLLPQIQKLEVVYRGFGPGREAVTKAILGSEGKKIRPLIVKLSDSTRLKFGGTRSKKPRRLG